MLMPPTEPRPTSPAMDGTAPKTWNVLLTFCHGLGDAVQFTIVLKHLQKLRPEWNVDIATLFGKHSAFEGLCRNTYILDQAEPVPCCQYQERFQLNWDECRESLRDKPSTKPSRCLSEIFHLPAQPDLFRYEIQRSAEDEQLARRYLASICPFGARDDGRFPVVVIHYEGNTSGEKKNLDHNLIRNVCETVQNAGYTPLILDWDRRSPLPDNRTIFCPDANHKLWPKIGTGDAARLAALIECSALMIGIDSGPLHVAGATTTPTIGVWTNHHPVHFFDLADNVMHLIPRHHEALAAGPEALDYFASHYQFRGYNQLQVDLPALVEHQLTGVSIDQISNQRFLKELHATSYDAQYYDEHKRAGLDYLEFGDWQRQYGRWLVHSLKLRGKRILDVGCACGSILRGLNEAGATGHGVDLCETMIALGRQKWPDLAPSLNVCDAVNLHLYPDQHFDAIHSAQVAEHWKPELVPFILRELARVTVEGGLFYCALDTSEMFARQGREMENEDPTHICIQTMNWWHDQLAKSGWELCTHESLQPLRMHEESFLNRYDWDWFVARRSGH
ncbi:methyltransferase domain-containing protein [Schlesneria paludicola]|uniref:methyltransferase domain-containing protein n=1 Tax=Schlesneria paludicola TaxID=360056 RepID=UPI000299E42C|nr:methyltransferase domain-containing protein [Schlesneria paludicola]